MEIAHKTYSIIRRGKSQAISIKMFANQESVVRHFEEHILSETESWERVFSRAWLENARNNLSVNNVIEQEAYDDVTNVLDKGIQYAMQAPLYVWVQQKIESTGRERELCYGIAEDGFILILDESCLRTVYFCLDLNKNPSKHALFNTAWKDIKRKISRPKYLDDKKDGVIVNCYCEWISEMNWTLCPNPYQRPSQKEHGLKPEWRKMNRDKYLRKG